MLAKSLATTKPSLWPLCFCSPIDAYNPDDKQFPAFKQARDISFTQEAGEILIIPTGWFHQVQCTNIVTFNFKGLSNA